MTTLVCRCELHGSSDRAESFCAASLDRRPCVVERLAASLVSEADALGVEARLHFSRSQLLTSQQKRTSRQRLVSPDTTRSDTVSPPRLITFGFEASHPDPVRAERLRTVYTSQFKQRVLNEMHGQVSHLHSGVNPSTPIRLGAPVLTLYQSERLIERMERFSLLEWPAASSSRPHMAAIRRRPPWS